MVGQRMEKGHFIWDNYERARWVIKPELYQLMKTEEDKYVT